MSDDVRIVPDEMRIIVQEAPEEMSRILAQAPMIEGLASLLDEDSGDS